MHYIFKFLSVREIILILYKISCNWFLYQYVASLEQINGISTIFYGKIGFLMSFHAMSNLME